MQLSADLQTEQEANLVLQEESVEPEEPEEPVDPIEAQENTVHNIGTLWSLSDQ